MKTIKWYRERGVFDDLRVVPANEFKRLEAKCAHCPEPAVVDITLGDPINYSLCQRCADLEDHIHDECVPQKGIDDVK